MKRLMKIVLGAVFLLFSGCALQPTPTKPKIDPALPKVSKVRTLSDINAVALEWTPIYDERVDGYYIYRGEGSKLKRITIVKDRYSSHYLDQGLKPNKLYTYQISVFTKDRESLPSEPVSAKTLPVPEAVPFVDAIDHLPREVKLIWRPHPNLRIKGYVIQRSEPQNQKWKDVATVEGRLNAEYIDKGLKDNHIYYYRIIAKTYDGILSKPSKTVEANTKPRPSIVKGLQATKNLPKRIELHWFKNPEPDIVYYKVYKSLFEIGPYLSVAKTKEPKYVDLMKEDGVKRYYKVTAVDKDGLESFKQDVPAMGQTLPKPLPPVVTQKSFDGRTVYISWTSPDNRAVKYMVKKREILGVLNYKDYTFKNVTSTSFTDSGLKAGAKYIYKVFAIDSNGLISKPSEEIVVKTRE